jgi:hypothetical protein
MAVRAREAAATPKDSSQDAASSPETTTRTPAQEIAHAKELLDEEKPGNQNNANCSPARAASMKSSTPVPLTTAPTHSMNFASETTGTPNSRAR